MLSQSLERSLPHGAEQLFDIAADVEAYPEFLPSWLAVRVRDRQAGSYRTDQVLGLGLVRIRFSSETRLNRPFRIEVISSDPAFRQFGLRWTFEPQPNGGCSARLEIALELRSRLLQALVERIMSDTAAETMACFEARAAELYGPPAA